MNEGYYPDYVEQSIDFLPTYKMSQTEHSYVNKKNQAPSYCDRILFKSNCPTVCEALFYRSLHQMHGSDHRPVQLGLSINLSSDDTSRMDQDVCRILDQNNPRQGFGEIRVTSVSIANLDLSKSLQLARFISRSTQGLESAG